MYCIYTNTNVSDELASKQHIIPLSLGGVDNFSINTHREMNSFLGSNIEAPLINEFTVFLNRMHHDIKGQSGKLPELKIKKAKVDGNPVSVKWNKHSIDIYDTLNHNYIKNRPVNVELKLPPVNLWTRFKFISKIALETGYYLFNEIFIKYADCETLRKAIFCDDLSNQNLSLKYYDNYTPQNNVKDEDVGFYHLTKLLIDNIGTSCVIVVFTETGMIIEVGILGKYLGSLNFFVENIKYFPINDIMFRQGHVLICKDKRLFCDSFYNSIYELNSNLNLININEYIINP